MGTIFQYLLVFGNPDPIGLLPQEQWQHRIRFKLFRNTPGELTHGR